MALTAAQICTLARQEAKCPGYTSQSGQLLNYGNAMPGAFQTAMAPGQQLQQIGANYENLAGNQINDQLRIFNEMQNRPWEQLARSNAIYSGVGGLGAKSTSTSQQPGTNWGQTALGYGLAGLGGLFI